MKAIVAGGRKYNFVVADALRLAYLLGWYRVHEVVHGNNGHVDKAAGRVGKALGLIVTPFDADWDMYGKSAGPRRNREMGIYVGAEESLLITWPGGAGTANMLECAEAIGIPHIEAWK